MCITLSVRDDVSINDLLQVARTRPVVKTPHVGNNSPNNLFAAKCGFEILWVDSTIPKRDTNANPHLLIKGGTATPLVEGSHLIETLTTHTLVTQEGLEASGFTPGESLVEGHIKRMRAVFPGTHVETNLERLQRYADLTESVLEIATCVLPHKWWRRVDAEGKVRKIEKGDSSWISSWRDVSGQVYLLPKREGWIVPNDFNILIDLVVQTTVGNSPEVWMLSGPDMIRYLPDTERMQELRIAYEAVSRKLGLLREIQIHLVPFTKFKFAVRQTHAGHLESLFETLADHSDRKKIRSLAQECPDLWTKTEKRDYFSQHDMSEANDLYAPETMFSLPLSEIDRQHQMIRSTLS